MVYTEYDPLEEVIVADSYVPGDLDHLFPDNSLSSFNRILEETKQDFDAVGHRRRSGRSRARSG